MKLFVNLTILFVTLCLVQQTLQYSEYDKWGNNQGNFKDKIAVRQFNLVDRANKLIIKLQQEGRMEDAKKLANTVNMTNSIFKDFTAINMDQEYNFSVKAIIRSLKQAQNNLESMINRYEREQD